MAEDLRVRYARAIANAECEQRPRCVLCMTAAVMAVRDEELARLRAQLAALDELHPLVELSWYHPCRQHSMMDEQAVLDSCPDCSVTTYMGCPRCDDDCEIRAIIHPEEKTDDER